MRSFKEFILREQFDIHDIKGFITLIKMYDQQLKSQTQDYKVLRRINIAISEYMRHFKKHIDSRFIEMLNNECKNQNRPGFSNAEEFKQFLSQFGI